MIPREEEPEYMERMFPTTSEEAGRGPDDCLETAAHLHAHSEGELDPIRLRRVDEHLARCEACREALRGLREERLWCMELLVESPRLSPRFAEKVTERIRARMRVDAVRKRRAWIARGAAASVVLAAAAILAPRHIVDPGVSTAAFVPSAPEAGLESMDVPSLSSRTPHAIPSSLPENEGYPETMAFPARISIVEKVWESIIQSNPPRWGVPKDPCAPDPNRDGRTDYRDVVHFIQVDLCGASEAAICREADREGADETSSGEPDCDELCLRA